MKKVMGLSLFVLGFANLAMACDCALAPSPDVEFKESNAVFVGEVLETKVWEKTRLQVLYNLKGAGDEEIEIVATGMCGFIFELKEKYLVYAKKEKDYFTVTSCGQTKKFSAATEEIKHLITK